MRKAEKADEETWGGGETPKRRLFLGPRGQAVGTVEGQSRSSKAAQWARPPGGEVATGRPRCVDSMSSADARPASIPTASLQTSSPPALGGGALRGQRGPLCKAEWGDGPLSGPTCLTWATSLMSASSLTSCSSFFSWLRSVRKPSPILCRAIRETRFPHLFSPPQPQARSSPTTPPPRKHRTPGASQVPTTETCPQMHAPPPAPHRPETRGPVSAHPQGPHPPEPRMDRGLPAAPARPGHPTLPPTLQHSAVSKRTPAAVSLFLI